MTRQEFIDRIVERFGFEPTADQLTALRTFAAFLADRERNVVMLMRGSAGTGKTSLAAAMVRELRSLGQRLVLMAPTGRAAKVFAQHSGLPAYTIHRTIYREKSFDGADTDFNINFNRHRRTLFVVDEASMVSNEHLGESHFGSGSLLDDLMEFVYSGDGCRLLLIGDAAQLPPVGEAESPALSAAIMQGYAMRVYQCDLREVLRQSAQSGILFNATRIRNQIGQALTLPKIRFSGFPDIIRLSGEDLVESLASSYSEVGQDETLVVTRSNKRANIYNQGIRATVLDSEGVLTGGDRLMVVRNKYMDNRDEEASLAPSPLSPAGGSGAQGRINPSSASPVSEGNGRGSMSFIANGDTCVVRHVSHFRDLYGFHFADATLSFPDYDDGEITTTVILDALLSEAPALTREQSTKLYNQVQEDYEYISRKPDRMKAMRQDIYLGALQVKYAYAVTCHKAQGGQWRHVYVDQGYMTDDMLTPDYLHWLYTAFTRATDKLFLVNWPETQVEE